MILTPQTLIRMVAVAALGSVSSALASQVNMIAAMAPLLLLA